MRQELHNFDKPFEIFDQQMQQNNRQLNEKFDQFNTNQNSGDFKDPTDSIDQQQNQNLVEFGQLLQNWNNHNFDQQSHNQQNEFGNGRENYEQQTSNQQFRSSSPEKEIVPKYVSLAESNSNHLDMQHYNDNTLPTQQTEQLIVSQPTLSTEQEKTGFWASVGKKFTSAKDKVSSWFRKKSD